MIAFGWAPRDEQRGAGVAEAAEMRAGLEMVAHRQMENGQRTADSDFGIGL